jgi:hypothetical protein
MARNIGYINIEALLKTSFSIKITYKKEVNMKNKFKINMKKTLCISLLLQASSVFAQIPPEEGPKDFSPKVYGAYSQWHNSNLNSYGYSLERICLCSGRNFRVTVIQDKVISVYNTDTGEYVEKEYLSQFKTMETLFADLMKANNTAYQINSQYHYKLGYPTNVFIDYDSRMMDEETIYRISSLDVIIVD